MKLKHRTFPYPVVGNGDDVDAGFQTPIQVHRRDEAFELDVRCMMSSESLEKLINKKQAGYGLHVECTRTLYRKLFPLRVNREGLASARIEVADVSGAVEVNVVVYAKEDIPRYKVSEAHSDYGNKAFFVSRGDFLAISEGTLFDADIRRDMLRSIDSIMTVSPRDDNETEMEADFNGDKIAINLSKDDFESYQSVKRDMMFRELAAQAIVLPVLVEALEHIKSGSPDYEDLRWFRNLTLRIGDKGLSLDTGTLVLAQQLLESPLQRLMTAYRKKLDEGEE